MKEVIRDDRRIYQTSETHTQGSVSGTNERLIALERDVWFDTSTLPKSWQWHDSQMLPELMHGKETRLYGDGAYAGQEVVIKKQAPKAKNFTQARAYRNKPLTDEQKARNKTKSRVKAKVEHPFLWVKRIWGFAKTRYRGLQKNPNRALMLLLSYNVMKANVQLTG